MNKLFSIEELDAIYKGDSHPSPLIYTTLAKQLADTMRENERLREALEEIASMIDNHLIGNHITEAIGTAQKALKPYSNKPTVNIDKT